MWSSCVWTSLYQAMKTFRRGGTRGERQSCKTTAIRRFQNLLRDLVGGVHATCGLINQPLIFTEGNPDHPRMWKWLTGRTGYPQIELKPGGASITVTGALEPLEVVLELWGVWKNMQFHACKQCGGGRLMHPNPYPQISCCKVRHCCFFASVDMFSMTQVNLRHWMNGHVSSS